MEAYHERADLGSWSKHEFALAISIVDLTRELDREIIGPPNWFIQQTLPITSTERKHTIHIYQTALVSFIFIGKTKMLCVQWVVCVATCSGYLTS